MGSKNATPEASGDSTLVVRKVGNYALLVALNEVLIVVRVLQGDSYIMQLFFQIFRQPHVQ